jgi:pyruvate,water dikinase
VLKIHPAQQGGFLTWVVLKGGVLMNDWEVSGEFLLDALKERAKELNCLYQVDEVLGNPRLSLPEIFEGIIRVIPPGWQFPEVCHARIVCENRSYQTPGYHASSFSESCNIKVDNKTVGSVEVVYTSEVPKSEEGYFLEKERKLIRTIADRISQTILHRRMEQILQEWNTSRHGLQENGNVTNEWMIIIELLRRTDQDMLLLVCRKMLNYLCWNGVKEAEEVLWDFRSGRKWSPEHGELNYPIEKLPLGNVETISEKAFGIASHNLSSGDISMKLKKWILEEKASSLIKAVGRIDASVGEIIEAIARYKNLAEKNKMLYSPTERWLEVALIRLFLSDKLEFISIARQYIGISDFYDIVNRLIFPAKSHGKIGGKSTGLFLAQQILKKESANLPMLRSVRVPKTWYITTDEIKEFLHYNNLQELNEQKYKELYEIRIDYPHIIQIMKNSQFPQETIKSLAMALDNFGDIPLIVRSSSLLEDQIGAAFSGKYKSLFLANQGDKQQRLEALMDAIVEVYASMYSPDSIQYRAEKGLLDFHEEMGIMIQEVVGTRIGPYYLPLLAGVAFSNNEFRWSPRIKHEDGLIRLVMGLGTRAVDRMSDDFPGLISPGQPGLRVNIVPEEIKRYSPKKVDVLNLEKNTFETIEISSLLKEFGHLIPNVHQIVSIHHRDYVTKPFGLDINFEEDDLVVTFEGLVTDTPFIRTVVSILKTLKDKLGTPVDIEFASNGNEFYLLQCRPQSFGTDNFPAPIPKDIPTKDIIFSANRFISNGIIRDISHIVYVDPEGYNSLQKLDDMVNIGKVVGLLNSLLPKHRFILMGPGRWGSRGDIKMGVQVTYADINNTAALIEIARRKSSYVPELSFGTHFFQDLVESNIRYLPLYPDNKGVAFNELFLTRSDNILAQLLPDFNKYEEVVKVIDVPSVANGKVLKISMNAELEEAIGVLELVPNKTILSHNKTSLRETTEIYDRLQFDDKFWRWRYYMAERIAVNLDPQQFGVKNIYVFGSTNNGTAGPGSDIDLLIHFQGTEQQHDELVCWLKGWSLCLAEINYLKTGYSSEGLLDIHIVTDEDIVKKSVFATKIGAVTDPAYPLKMKIGMI